MAALPSADRPLAESCVVCGRTPPRFVCFALSGSLCNLAQLALDRLLLLLLGRAAAASSSSAGGGGEGGAVADLHELPAWVPTACWTLSYTLSVSLRHASHAVFVFGRHADSACRALMKTYLTYASTIVASTLLNLALISVRRVSCRRTLARQRARRPLLRASLSSAAAHGGTHTQCTW